MKNQFSNKVRVIFKTIRKMNDPRLFSFFICICIATMFWFLNALNKQYSVELTFPVKYTNLPKNKVLANSPPESFRLRVNSFGFTLLRYKLSMAISPLVFNVNDFTDQKMEFSHNTHYSLPTNQFIARLSEQISSELIITDIQPDTLTFIFDRVVTKKVKIVPNVSFDLKKQYFVNSVITTTPDSVLVTGPKAIVDTLRFVYTVHQHFKNLDKTVQQNILLNEHKNLIFKPKRVLMKIPVEEFTEKNVLVPIQIRNIPRGVRVNLFPDRAKVNFLISLNRFSEVNGDGFKISVFYEDILDKKDLLELSIDAQPSFVKSVSVSPKQIEYLIEK